MNLTARHIATALLTATLALLLLAGTPVAAQQPGTASIGDPGAPLEIEADNGLELYQDRQLVVAKGNVIARQGTVVLRADLLSASYEEAGGERQIKRLDAVGNVRINTGSERLFGEHATYDLARELMVVTGDNMRIETELQTITAEESLEFWGAEQRAVARGNAVVTQDTTSLRADLMEAMLTNKDGRSGNTAPTNVGIGQGSSVERVRAWGAVTIRTPSEIVEGDEGDYDVANQVATLTGNVRISRGENQLNGHRAIVNLKTGVSRLVGGNGTRVRTILFPNSEGGVEPPDLQGSSQPSETETPTARFVVPPKPPGSNQPPADRAADGNQGAAPDQTTTPPAAEAEASGEKPAILQPGRLSEGSADLPLPPVKPGEQGALATAPIPPPRPAGAN